MNHQASIAITTKDEDQVKQCYEDDIYDEDVNEKVNYGDVSESLFIRRICLNEKQEDSQKHRTLKIRFTCQGKVCNVIINNGSMENLVSQYMIHNLQLKIMKHPSPYSLG